jgi:hypothetical protein
MQYSLRILYTFQIVSFIHIVPCASNNRVLKTTAEILHKIMVEVCLEKLMITQTVKKFAARQRI